jgi:hypothetical protein
MTRSPTASLSRDRGQLSGSLTDPKILSCCVVEAERLALSRYSFLLSLEPVQFHQPKPAPRDLS